MEAVLTSTLMVAVAEMGDKTQLLSFVLAARYRKPWPIAAGILLATLANHFLAAAAGTWVAGWVPPGVLKWIIALSFFAFGLWALKPDELEEDPAMPATGVFLATLATFFLVEMGDKTQLATIALAARYDALVAVVTGSTLGMMVANAPAVWMGDVLTRRINMKVMRWVAAGLFGLLGILTLLAWGVDR